MSEPLPIPKALYPCVHCYEDHSWPVNELHWSEECKNWVCNDCWREETHGPKGATLEDEIERQKYTMHT